jgi:PPOX class probable F420-dependent enzyme
MTTTPSVPDSHRDLLETKTAILATNGPDGLPQVTAVAFHHDEADDLIKISLNDTRQKTKNLHRDPNGTLFILDPVNPYRTLEIRGRTELVPDPDFAFAKTAGARYGQDFHQHDLPGETRSVVILHPSRINAINIGG